MEEKIEKYYLLGIRKRVSKKTEKEYYVAFIVYENNYGFNILNVMIKEEQVGPLLEAQNDDNFNINDYMKLEYNSFNNRYDMKLTYGL